MTAPSPGRLAYEADVSRRPTYHDGNPRKPWDALGKFERWSWEQATATSHRAADQNGAP